MQRVNEQSQKELFEDTLFAYDNVNPLDLFVMNHLRLSSSISVNDSMYNKSAWIYSISKDGFQSGGKVVKVESVSMFADAKQGREKQTWIARIRTPQDQQKEIEMALQVKRYGLLTRPSATMKRNDIILIVQGEITAFMYLEKFLQGKRQ